MGESTLSTGVTEMEVEARRQQEDQLQELRQQVEANSKHWSRTLQEFQEQLRTEADARGQLQEGQSHWLQELRDMLVKTDTNHAERLVSALCDVDDRLGVVRDKNSSLVEQTHHQLTQKLGDLQNSHAVEFEKIEASFNHLQKQASDNVQQLRTDVSARTT